MAIRSDSWAAKLEEDEQDAIYIRWRTSAAKWETVAQFIEDEYKVPAPSRTALYRWRDQFEPVHRARREAQLAAAGETMKAFAETRKITDKQCADALMMLGVEATSVTGDSKTGSKLIQDACAVMDRVHKANELELKRRAQSVKEDELKLAQERLKLELAKNAKAVEAVKDVKLTPAEREAKLREIFGI